MNLRDRRRLASLTAGCGLLTEACFDPKLFTFFPHWPWPLPVLHHRQREKQLYSPFPSFRMDILEYHAKCLNMVIESLRPRNPLPIDNGPKSDCCIARLVPVGDEMYACEACGALCSDGSIN